MKNTLADLNNYLFEALERLDDDEMTEENFQKEVAKSEAITKVASHIIKAGDLSIRALKVAHDCGIDMSTKKIPLLEDKKPNG